MKNFIVKETSLEEALKVFGKIIEFDRQEASTVSYCENRIGKGPSLVLSAYVEDVNAGYLIAYEKDSCFYCWVAGVAPEFRRMGILTEMMRLYEEFAKKHNYQKLAIKTLNNKREMLNYLVKNNWDFIDIIPNQNVKEVEMILEKTI